MLGTRYPDVPFEVVNAAMTAINSHAVREIARDCSALEPDLLVVYMGNNEVIGPYGPGSAFQAWTPRLKVVRASLWVKSTRVGQWLSDVIGFFRRGDDKPGYWRGMEMFSDTPVAADDPRLTTVYHNYRQNLTDICNIARRARANVILATVAVNLRDFPPLASRHRSGLTAGDLATWEASCRAGAALSASNRWQEAIGRYEEAAKLDDRFAELAFRMGECLLKAGRPAEARGRFELARDLDVLRFRADSRLNAVVREVAGARAADGVRLVDAERALAESNPEFKGIAGGELFHEHVHLTFDGNYVLARAVLEQVCAALPQLPAPRGQNPVPSRQRCAELLAFTPWDEYESVAQMVAMTSRDPFTRQFDHRLRQAAARRRRAERRRRAATPEALEAAWRTYQAALAASPGDWRLHYHAGLMAMKNGRPGAAVEHLRFVVATLPWDASKHQFLGDALAAQGRVGEAIDRFRQALAIDPANAGALNSLGIALSTRGQVDEAIAAYRDSLNIDPDNPHAHNNLAIVLTGRGQYDEALAHFEKALKISPDYAEAHNNLGALLAGRGRFDDAIAHFRRAVELEPGNAVARRGLNAALKSAAP
jgi:tetratricopeptide (TPR) repeat protein